MLFRVSGQGIATFLAAEVDFFFLERVASLIGASMPTTRNRSVKAIRVRFIVQVSYGEVLGKNARIRSRLISQVERV
jgi:hypothetical protein